MSAREERGLGLPLDDIERIARHYNISIEDACDLLERYMLSDLLPERGSGLPAKGLPTNFEMVGHTSSELEHGLRMMQSALKAGDRVEIALVSSYVPTEEDLAQFYVSATSAGSPISYPSFSIIDGLPVTSFKTQYLPGEPGTTGFVWAALIPLIPTALIVGLISFGIVKIGDISKALVPLLLISFGGIIVLAGILTRRSVTETAGRLVEKRYAKNLKYLPGTAPPREYQFPKEKFPPPEKVGPEHLPRAERKRTRDMVEVLAWSERDRVHIEIRDKVDETTIAEWWDDDARQMFEDGFFKGGVPSLSWEKPSQKLVDSVLDYAEDVGLLIPESGWAYRIAKGYEVPKEYLHLLEPDSFPKRKKALEGLDEPISIVEVHSDGDLTVADRRGSKFVVTTEGDVFLHRTAHEALQKILGDQYLTITDPGKSQFKKDEVVSLWAFYKENERLRQRGEAQASGTYEIVGKKPGDNGRKNLLEFLGDSPEFLAYTIDMTGMRQQLDETFQAAIARARS